MPERPHNDPPTDSLTTMSEAVASPRGGKAGRADVCFRHRFIGALLHIRAGGSSPSPVWSGLRQGGGECSSPDAVGRGARRALRREIRPPGGRTAVRLCRFLRRSASARSVSARRHRKVCTQNYVKHPPVGIYARLAMCAGPCALCKGGSRDTARAVSQAPHANKGQMQGAVACHLLLWAPSRACALHHPVLPLRPFIGGFERWSVPKGGGISDRLSMRASRGPWRGAGRSHPAGASRLRPI